MKISSSPNKSKKKFFYTGAFIFFSVLLLGYFSSYLLATDDDWALQYLKKDYQGHLMRYQSAKFKRYRDLLFSSAYASLDNFVSSFTREDNTPRININIKFKDFKHIKDERDKQLLADAVYLEPKRNYLNATIQYKNDVIPVKLRLKGGRKDHIEHEKKWSFRIKTKGSKKLFGMSRMSIQSPHTRSFQHEPLFHSMARDLGLIAVRYQFVRVSINGEDIGLMALEEHFGKELIEHHGHREGLVFKHYDKPIFDAYFAMKNHSSHPFSQQFYRSRDMPEQVTRNTNLHLEGPFAGIGTIYYNPFVLPIESYVKSTSLLKSEINHQYQTGIGLLRGAYHGEVPVEEVFDIDKFARFFALNWLWSTSHSVEFTNQRFYFNPLTYRFEPISFDTDSYNVSPISEIAKNPNRYDNQITYLLFKSSDLNERFKFYVKSLADLIQSQGYYDKILAREDSLLEVLRTEYPLLPPVFLPHLKGVAKYLEDDVKNESYFKRENKLNLTVRIPEDLKLPKVVNAYYRELEEDLLIELENYLPRAVNITELRLVSKEARGSRVNLEYPIELPITRRAEPPKIISFSLPRPNEEEFKIIGKAKVDGQDVLYDFEAMPYAEILSSHPLRSNKFEFILNKYPFFKLDTSQKKITIEKGSWQVQDMLSLSEGYSLHIEQGAKLQFASDAGLIVKGHVEFLGSESEPIVFEAIGDSWRGLAVLDAKTLSKLNNVEFHDTTYNKRGLWHTTAGVLFYQSDVAMQNVVFDGTTAEDALNIVRSNCNLDQLSIKNTRSDAFDGDYVKCRVRDISFDTIGGDGLDVSGSLIQAKNIFATQVRDKAVSIGEKSKARVFNLQVRSSGTGIAAKDLSELEVKGAKFESIEHALLMAYQKKPEYGDAKVFAEDLEYDENKEQPFVTQDGSEMQINGKYIATVGLDVESLYSDGYMKKN